MNQDNNSTGPSDDADDSNGGAAATERLADAAKQLQAQTTEVFDKLRPQLDMAAEYVRAQPVKTMLMAAACGAALMGVVTLAARPSRRGIDADDLRDLRDSIDLDDIRDSMETEASRRGFSREEVRRVAQSAADKAAQFASEAYERAAAVASSAAERATSAAKTTRNAADDALDTLSETVKDWRDQAAPLVDKIKPQIDAVTSYARNEPAKSALAVAALGAAIAGVIALMNRDADDDMLY
ncbi:hypothetical protein [Piscinibacter koreensis]|uniref:DUF3618 domain-containing protein n=1 Tax=Piscinibacter koreensis TaxID=2742824 RepID=A0A7Y6TVJ4_9BURK|nr:hypothetical protein [Schlegelella koreensis]NUZ05105.1 hypothetical protein [Schlegelella koreensis]